MSDAAVVVPAKHQLEQFETLNPEEQKTIVDQVLNMQSVTAEASLRSAQGYDILRELYRNSAELVLSTSQFVLPVSNDLDDICIHLSDPEGFKRSYATLLGDINRYRQDLAILWECHKDKTGAPSDDEITDVFSIADGYNKLMTRWDSAISPLLDSLKDILCKEYTPVLEKELNESA